MTKEERELLLIDLCARLPYGVICQFIWTYCNETTDGEDVIAKENDNIRNIDIHTKEIQADYYGEWVDLEHCKPYLCPLSSMTEEEEYELDNIRLGNYGEDVDWLNKNMFDYRIVPSTGKSMIESGLAIKAPEGMYVNI